LAAGPELARRLGQAGRQRILQDFTLKRQVEKFIELFRDVVKNA
jgi:hypothetical protein